MKSILPWDEAEEVTFECEPGTLSEKKLEAIKNFGVTRLSLGIENFDDHILETNGRAHRSKEVFRAYEFARQLGFDNINADLISGMLEETDDNWSDCIDQVIDLSPDCVTIYQMEVPFNTTIFKSMKEQGKLAAPVADWRTKRRWVDEAYGRLESAGYTVSSAYTAVKNPEKTKFIYRDRLWSGADMVALGVASFDTWEVFTTKTSLTSISTAKPPRAKVPSSGGRFLQRMRNALSGNLSCNGNWASSDQAIFGINLESTSWPVFPKCSRNGEHRVT